MDADGALQGMRNHEAYGTGGNRKGHQALIEDKEAEVGHDAKEAIEDNVDGSESDLEFSTDLEIQIIEIAIYNAANDYNIPDGSNWGPATIYHYSFTESKWKDKPSYGM